MTPLTRAQLQAFRDDGARVLRGAFTGWLETMAAGIARNMTDPGTSRRRAQSLHFVGRAARWVERPGRTSPPFQGHRMQPGENLRDDWFPIVWRA